MELEDLIKMYGGEEGITEIDAVELIEKLIAERKDKNLDLNAFRKYWDKNVEQGFINELSEDNSPEIVGKVRKMCEGWAERGWNWRYFYDRW